MSPIIANYSSSSLHYIRPQWHAICFVVPCLPPIRSLNQYTIPLLFQYQKWPSRTKAKMRGPRPLTHHQLSSQILLEWSLSCHLRVAGILSTCNRVLLVVQLQSLLILLLGRPHLGVQMVKSTPNLLYILIHCRCILISKPDGDWRVSCKGN